MDSPDGIADGFGLDSCEELPRLLPFPLVGRVPPLPVVSDMLLVCLLNC